MDRTSPFFLSEDINVNHISLIEFIQFQKTTDSVVYQIVMTMITGQKIDSSHNTTPSNLTCNQLAHIVSESYRRYYDLMLDSEIAFVFRGTFLGRLTLVYNTNRNCWTLTGDVARQLNTVWLEYYNTPSTCPMWSTIGILSTMICY